MGKMRPMANECTFECIGKESAHRNGIHSYHNSLQYINKIRLITDFEFDSSSNSLNIVNNDHKKHISQVFYNHMIAFINSSIDAFIDIIANYIAIKVQDTTSEKS